ncbi:MAG: DUF3857 domain-containing protein [Blastocatellia bacterium]
MRLLCLLVFLTTNVSGTGIAVEKVPDWLKAATEISTAKTKDDALILFDEGSWVVAADGKMEIRLRYAVKILKKEGRGEAEVSHYYNTDYTQIKDCKVWLIGPNRSITEYGKKQIPDRAILGNDLYSESRRISLSLAEGVEPGSIFAYEIIKEQRSLFSQIEWWFQGTSPVLESRLMVTVPPNWQVAGRFFPEAGGPALQTGTTHVWEMRDLDGLKLEEGSPGGLSVRMVVNLIPPEGQSPLRTFHTWGDVSRFLSELSDPRSAFTPEMEGKARELTAGLTDEFERIRAIGKFAQAINYVSIQTNLGRGGGYQPKPASDIFKNNYGDCKDKANLMRAMLKALQIESYPVSINAMDRSQVNADFPSLDGFNHCILAVRVGEETKHSSVVDAKGLGRLLLFDPTDPYTPLGEMPAGEQGSHALVLAGERGVLIRTPEVGPEAILDGFQTSRKIELELEVSGQAKGRFVEKSIGKAAVEKRAKWKQLEKTAFFDGIQKWVTRTLPFTELSNLQTSDQESRFEVAFDFSSPTLAAPIDTRLLVFKPALFGMAVRLPKMIKTRLTPLMMSTTSYQETVEVTIPDGFEVDELPEPFTVRHALGSFHLECRVAGARIIYERSLRFGSGVVAPEEYPALLEFLGNVGGAEDLMVTLIRKG